MSSFTSRTASIMPKTLTSFQIWNSSASMSRVGSTSRVMPASSSASVSLLVSSAAGESQSAYTSSSLATSTPTETKMSPPESSPWIAATRSSLVIDSSASISRPYVIPTGLPSGNYSLADCSNPILPNPDSPDYITKCLYSNCQQVKANAITYWQEHQKMGQNGTILDQFAYYLGPTNGMYCDTEYSLLGCTDAGACTSYNYPGGWLLMREVIQFTQFYRTIYQGFANNCTYLQYLVLHIQP